VVKRVMPMIYANQTPNRNNGRSYVCPKCGSDEFYTDPASNYRHCIPCENLKEEKIRAKKRKWEQTKRKSRDRREYHKEYRRRKREELA